MDLGTPMNTSTSNRSSLPSSGGDSFFSLLFDDAASPSNNSDSGIAQSTDDINSVYLFVEDDHNVDPKKVQQYILMLARGVHELIPSTIDISGVDSTTQR